MKHQAAIAQLDIAAGVCENNAPIHEADGNTEQAALSRANAAGYREAIDALTRDGQATDRGDAA